MAQHNNPQNKAGKPDAVRPVERRRGPDFVHFYANNVEVAMSNWDIQIVLGEVVVDQDKKLAVQEKAVVVMSPQHAKAFLNILLGNVAAFEKQFGVVTVPGMSIEIQSHAVDSKPTDTEDATHKPPPS